MRIPEDESTLREVDAFYERVHRSMEKSGLELKDLARRMGVSESSLAQMMDAREIPDVFTLRKLSEALDVTYNDLFAVRESMYMASPCSKSSDGSDEVPVFYAREVAYYKVDEDDGNESDDSTVCVLEVEEKPETADD